jgi:hypothetical protein
MEWDQAALQQRCFGGFVPFSRLPASDAPRRGCLGTKRQRSMADFTTTYGVTPFANLAKGRTPT